jgi:hypothetical protein
MYPSGAAAPARYTSKADLLTFPLTLFKLVQVE